MLGNAYTQQDDGSWRSTSLAAFAGGYTATFAQTFLREAYENLVAWRCPVTFAEQRRYHDHLETIPNMKRQKLNPATLPVTVEEGAPVHKRGRRAWDEDQRESHEYKRW